MGKMQCALKQLLSAEGMLSERTLRVLRADDVGRSHCCGELHLHVVLPPRLVVNQPGFNLALVGKAT